MKQFKTRTYEINPDQLKILNDVKSLPQKYLHYVIGWKTRSN